MLPDFTGGEYVIFPVKDLNELNSLDLAVTFRADSPSGLLAYVPGKIPGSFVAVSLSKSRVVLSMNTGGETVDTKSEPIAVSKKAGPNRKARVLILEGDYHSKSSLRCCSL